MTTRIFPGRYESLEKICSFVLETADTVGFNSSARYGIQLAVDEAATNIIEHAYGGENKGEIECSCEILPNGIQITLLDHGCQFNPDAVPIPETSVSLDDLKPRGLGIFFMHKMMDNVHYEFSDNCNVLTMIKRK